MTRLFYFSIPVDCARERERHFFDPREYDQVLEGRRHDISEERRLEGRQDANSEDEVYRRPSRDNSEE